MIQTSKLSLFTVPSPVVSALELWPRHAAGKHGVRRNWRPVMMLLPSNYKTCYLIVMLPRKVTHWDKWGRRPGTLVQLIDTLPASDQSVRYGKEKSLCFLQNLVSTALHLKMSKLYERKMKIMQIYNSLVKPSDNWYWLHLSGSHHVTLHMVEE